MADDGSRFAGGSWNIPAPDGVYLSRCFFAVLLMLFLLYGILPLAGLLIPVPLFGMLLLTQGIPLLVILWTAWKQEPSALSLRKKLGFTGKPVQLVRTVLPFFLFLLVAAMLLSSAVQQIFRHFSISPEDQMLVRVLTDCPVPVFWGIAVLAVCVAPVAEEILFRHIFFSYLAYRMNGCTAACLTALLFALLHGNLMHGPSLFVMSLLLQGAYRKTGTICTPVLIHSLFNLFSILSIIFIRSVSL